MEIGDFRVELMAVTEIAEELGISVGRASQMVGEEFVCVVNAESRRRYAWRRDVVAYRERRDRRRSKRDDSRGEGARLTIDN